MTEQNQARDLVATLRDALHQLEGALARTRDGVDDDRQPGRTPPGGCRSAGCTPTA